MSKWVLILGVVLGLVAAVLVNLHISSIETAQKGAAFVRLKPDVTLIKGQKISREMLTTVYLPERFLSLQKLAVPATADSREWILGRAVSRDVEAGSVLLHQHFIDDPRERFATRITLGKRALTLPVEPTTAVAYFVQPGSRVDILATFVRKESKGIGPEIKGRQQIAIQELVETKIIMQNVPVMAVDQATTRGSYLGLARQGFRTVTVEVTPEQAERLIFAQSQARGRLAVVLRNPDDQEIVNVPSVQWDSIN